MQTFIFKHF